MTQTQSPENHNRQPARGPLSPWRHLQSHLRLWPIAVVALVLDLWSKEWAFSSLDPREGVVVVPHLVRFQRSLNTGALFGLGKGMTPLFIAASILALGFVLYLFGQSTRDRRSLHIALGLVLAGALGNLHDRVFEIADVVEFNNFGVVRKMAGILEEQNERHWVLASYPDSKSKTLINADWSPRVVGRQGVVRDFIKMEPRVTIRGQQFDLYPWVFNLADVWLVVGVAVLLLNFWWERKAAAASAEAVASAGGSADT